MTVTADPTGTRAALAPVAPGVLAQVKGGKPWTVASLSDLLAGPARELPESDPFPEPAPVVKFTRTVQAAIDELPRLAGKVNVTERRMLTAAELAKVTDERHAITAVIKPLAQRSDAISEMVRAHQDVSAEKQRLAVPKSITRGGRVIEATPRVGSGVAKAHYLLASKGQPFETPVEGWEDGWQQRYVSGKPELSESLLARLLEEGNVTRAEYLALTRATRNIDSNKITAFIAKHPERGLEILAAITERSAPGASLYAPIKKKTG